MLNLDLRNLTADKIAEALPHIIGSLIPPEDRAKFERNNRKMPIDRLIRSGVVQFPPDQRRLALRLQNAFDQKDMLDFNEALEELPK